MKTNRSILIALTALSALSIGYSAKADLITNGGFETGDFTGWTTTPAVSGSHFFVYAGAAFGAPPHSGTYEAAFAGSGPGSDTISQTFVSTPGTVYDLTFWLAGAVAGDVNQFDVTFGGVHVFHSLNSGPFPFTQLSYAVTATGNSMTLDFSGFFHNSDYYLDDVSVIAEASTSVPDSGSTLGLLALSLAGLFGANHFRTLRLA